MQTIYTGSGLAARLPEDSGRPMSRLSDFIRQTEEFKYKAYKENEQEFLKNVNVDPVHFISTANQTAQLKALEAHNQEWAKKWQETNGNLSTEDKVAMIQQGNYLRSWQDKAIAQQQRYQQDLMMAQQNPTKFSVDEMAKRTQEYYNNGEYLYSTPPLKPQNFGMFLRSQSQKYNKDKYLLKTETVGNQRINFSTNIREEDIPAFIEDNIFIDEQATQGLIEDFKADNSEFKRSLLQDSNNDGKITDEDADKNVIVAWAKKNPKYIEAARNITSSAKNIPQASETEKRREGMVNLADFGKPTTYYKPMPVTSTKIGQTDYLAFHNFENVPIGNIPVGTNIRTLNPEGEEVKSVQNVITADLVGYDEIRDEFVFLATKDFENLYSTFMPAKGSGWRFAVKRSELKNPMYDSLKIEKNGKVIAIKDLVGTQTTTQTTNQETGQSKEDKYKAYKR